MNKQAQKVEGEPWEVAVLQKPRLPWHDAIGERFEIDRSGWKAIVETIFPSASSTDSVVLALAYCKARNLDIFKRPVHIVPMWDNKKKAFVETIWPGISEVRTTAFRTNQYAGADEATFGKEIERTFQGKYGPVTVTFPEWCQMTVYRLVGGHKCKFVGPKVLWLESYARANNKFDAPKAFPEEIGNELTAEEMEGRDLHYGADDAKDITPEQAPPKPPSMDEIKEVETTEANADQGDDFATSQKDDPEIDDADIVAPVSKQDIIDRYATCTDMETLEETLSELTGDIDQLDDEAQAEVQEAFERMGECFAAEDVNSKPEESENPAPPDEEAPRQPSNEEYQRLEAMKAEFAKLRSSSLIEGAWVRYQGYFDMAHKSVRALAYQAFAEAKAGVTKIR